MDVVNSVGDALCAFYPQGFVFEEIVPLVKSIEAITDTQPLDERSIRRLPGRASGSQESRDSSTFVLYPELVIEPLCLRVNE